MSPVVISLVASIVGAAASLAGVVFVRGTTAVPAAVWAVAAWVAMAIEMLVRSRGDLVDPGSAADARLVVAALSLCPAMSLLGAKRPQHGVWQLIVASLAVVLVLPLGPAVLAFPGSLPAVHILAKWFMLALAAIGWMNFIATRRGAAATLVTAGQIILMRPFMPGFGMAEQIEGVIRSPAIDAVALCMAAAGTLLAGMQACVADWRRGRAGHAEGEHPLAAMIDPVFLAVRETLGAAWALRIAERFGQIAASRGWPCRLTFRGLVVDQDQRPETDWPREAWRAFAAIMRRFVSTKWLRMHGAA
ncbi:MAG: hypothetical protein ACKOEX_10985 [Planctomycetia bacterium]